MNDVVKHFQRGSFEEKYLLPVHEQRRKSALFNSKLDSRLRGNDELISAPLTPPEAARPSKG